MRGILINPYLRKVTQIDVVDDIKAIYGALSHGKHKVSMVQIAKSFPNGDNLLVDEEGGLFAKRKVWKLNRTPYIGCGLILGSTGDGDWCDHMLGISDVNVWVSWTDLETNGHVS